MGTLFFAQLSSLPQYLHEQQSSAPRLGANFNKNAKANINRKDSLVSSGKASVRKKISRRPHPLSGLSASEISPLSNVSSGLKPQADATLEKKSALAKAARKLRKGGRKHVSRPPAQDYKSELPSWQGLSRLRIECTDFPENQFRGFSNSKPDNHRGFSIIKQQRMISGKFDDSEHGSATGGQSSNRERRSHHSSLGWETHTVFAIAGGCVPIGLRIFHCSHSRNVNSKVDLEYFGGNDSGQKYGSGGDSGGRGRGGGGGGDGGGDRLGPGDFSANCEGSLTDYKVVKEGTEEEQCSAVVASDMQEKHDGIDLSSNVEAQSIGKLLFFASLSLIAGDSEPKGKFGETGDAMSSIEGSKHSEDIHKAGAKSHVREKDVKGDPKQESPSCLPKGNMQRTFINLGERLIASAKAFCFDFIKSPLFDVSNAGGGSLELLPVHSDQGAHFSHQGDLNLNDDPLLSAVQDLDDAFQRESSTESWVTEQMANQRPSKSIDTSQSELNNIEQVVGLLSRVGQPALPERTGSLSQTTERYFTSNTASDAFDSCGYIEASSLNEGKQTASLQVAPLVPFLDRKLQPEQSDCPSECFAAATQSHGWSEDGLCWLTGLVHSVLTKRTGGQEKSCNEGGEALERKALVDEIVSLTVNQLLETDGAAAVAKRSEIEALRRLQREVFSDLLKIRERLDKIEQLIGLRRSSDFGNLSGVARTQLKGEVKAGFALMMLEDSNSRHARSSLEQAGMQTGLDVRFTFETPFRERDLLITQCIAGQGSSVGDGRALGGPISLGKVLYSAHINDDFSISVVPLGAQGKDVTEIVNPLQDQALTEFNSNGPVLFSHCKGSAVGATVSGSNFALSVAQYLSGWGNQISALGSSDAGSDPLCLSTLGQFLFQPSERMLFSLSGLNRYWPSPPLPTSMGLHWSEMGPLIIPKIQSQRRSRSTVTSQVSTSTSVSHGNNLGSPWDDPGIDCSDGILDNKGTSMQSIAVATEMELGEHVSIGGWAQVERGDWLQDSDSANLQWALSLARNSGRSVDWGVSIGGSKPDIWSMATSDQEGYPGYSGGDVGEVYGPQMHLEAFLKINCARGFTLQPGLLYVLNKYSHTPALMLRSSWTM